MSPTADKSEPTEHQKEFMNKFLGEFPGEKRIRELEADNERLKEELTEIEHKYRQALWLRHGHTALYGDDGEMQCAECHLDFKRDTLMAIELRLIDNSKAAVKAAGKEKG